MAEKKLKTRGYSGTASREEREYEKEHRALARTAAAEGIVLLKNEDSLLPLERGQKIALFGAGASRTVKGGTGSGDVNERQSISIFEGAGAAGFSVVSTDWIGCFEREYAKRKEEWKNIILKETEQMGEFHFFESYTSHKLEMPVGNPQSAGFEGPVEKMFPNTETDTAIYVLSRNAGEGADRYADKGDYFISDEEEELLNTLCERYEKIILIVNAGGPVDLSFTDHLPRIKSILFISQPGMEGGNAVWDVLSGAVSPCGKMVDTWALHYEDYPSSHEFSRNNGNLLKAYYEEGIYVGYRYFDTFEVPVRFGFGSGLSYTDFTFSDIDVKVCPDDPGKISVTLTVTNSGNTYSGREVVQVYVSCPQSGELPKEFTRLAAFAKTSLLAPGESENREICFEMNRLTSYEQGVGWVLDAGMYAVRVGNSLANAKTAGGILLKEKIVTEKTEEIAPLKEALKQIVPPLTRVLERYQALCGEIRRIDEIAQIHGSSFVREWPTEEVPARNVDYAQKCCEGRLYGYTQEDYDTACMLTMDECVAMVIGDPAKSHQEVIGNAGLSVPGAAGETSLAALRLGVGSMVLADGPAGLRLQKEYDVVDGQIRRKSFMASVENGFFMTPKDREFPENAEVEHYYQYLTAIPVGTMLAQTWDTALVRELGRAVGREMELFGVTLWLAPGMNIHRNPLCGRNFEYYSEDPLMSGAMAAAITEGVQETPGVGTTIKHFVANNCEEKRTCCDSVVSERALREIYLKGFEYAVKWAQPMSVMSSYNLLNGIHTANCYDTLTKVLRCEWGFEGMVMTDWMTTMNGPADEVACSTPAGCMQAGNDLIMPGGPWDFEKMKTSLGDGSLSEEAVRICAARVIHLTRATRIYEDARPYGIHSKM